MPQRDAWGRSTGRLWKVWVCQAGPWAQRRAGDRGDGVLGVQPGCPCSALGSAMLTPRAPWSSGCRAALQNSECPWPAAPVLLSPFSPVGLKLKSLNPSDCTRPGVRSR